MPTVDAPAKLNLTLEVLARRPDGYHGVRSVMVPIDLSDRLTIESAPSASFRCSRPELAEENLVTRALAAIGARDLPLAVTLVKRIPVGGGLGGGSSDAAAVIRLAMEGRLGDGRPRDWIALARRLGCDVPFFLIGGAALVEGTGERVIPLGRLPAWWCVVLQPPVAVLTATAYALVDRHRERHGVPHRSRSSSVSLIAVDALQRADFDALLASLTNDFHEPVLAAYPPIADGEAALRAAGARHPLLSGSGSCLFALCPDRAEARRLAAALDPRAGEAFVAALRGEPAWR